MDFLKKRFSIYAGFLFAVLGSLYLGVATDNFIGVVLFVLVLILAGIYLLLDHVRLPKTKPEKVKGFNWGNAALALLVLSFALYLLTKEVAFAVLIFLGLVLLFALDIVPKKWDHEGIRDSILELVYALDVALAGWFVIIAALGTTTPIDVVTSCSMLPVLERGDMIVLKGGYVEAQTIRFNGDFSKVRFAAKELPFSEDKAVQLYAPVLDDKELFELNAGRCDWEGTIVPCLKSISYEGKTFLRNASDEIIVYGALPKEKGYGLIIHRVFLKIVADDGTYYLTWGDNNQFPDQLYGIEPVKENHAHGKILYRIPYLGYLKLFLFMQFLDPSGCEHILRST
ncbi:hypothetical protein HY991_00465 [Candidatus Micrarchaeota archaeon]|nr:hypothetical protein [Candidatus Micrarchaeota archaeon]